MKKFREKASANYQIRLRPNRELENVFRAYETSLETERLDSEKNRQIYCELVNLEEHSGKLTVVPQVQSQVAAGDDDDEEQVVAVGDKPKWWSKVSVESNHPRTLAEISIEKIAKDFKSGSIIEKIWCQDAEDFGLVADIELPILGLFQLNNETFWKRLVQAKLGDVLELQKLLRNSETNWKKIGLELKLAEFIENLEQTKFDEPGTVEELEVVAEKLNNFVENLSIKKLMPRKIYDKNPFNEKARVVNFPSDECYHGSLEFLGGLTNLKSLSIKFDPGVLGCKYEKRFFQVATVDIENIGKALVSLKKLEYFTIKTSDLSEPMKMLHLLLPLKTMKHLKSIDLSYCNIKSKESGEYFEEFLNVHRSLKHLELKGNIFRRDFSTHLAHGIRKFAGKLNYFGLSFTPLLDNGLDQIIKSIKDRKNVVRLDISNCESGLLGRNDDCNEALISLIEREGSLREININGNDIKKDLTKELFIKALDKNYKILDLSCENCGFDTSEMLKIKVLLLRNKYYKDNPILKKENFSPEEEIEIENYLKRTKQPLLLKYKETLVPSDDGKKPYGIPSRAEVETTENYTNFAFTTPSNYFD